MTEYELNLPQGDVIAAVERCAAEQGLQIMRGDLGKYPGSTHWHFTLPGSSGTLEATWWPKRERLWLATHDNRSAAWQAEVIQRFQSAMADSHQPPSR